MRGTQRSIEGRVDFDGVKELREEFGFVEVVGSRRWVDVAGPVGIGPTGRTNAEVVGGGERIVFVHLCVSLVV